MNKKNPFEKGETKQMEKTTDSLGSRLSNTKVDFEKSYSQTLGLQILELKDGYCLGKLPIREEFLNPLGGLHGGLLYTVADTVGGLSAIRRESGKSVTTISGTMQFYRAALNLTELYAEAKTVKNGKRIAFVETELKDGEGTVYAKGSFSCAHFRLPEEKEKKEK
jgi:uncharacterized protein (TIGR00369 family)